MALNQGKYKPTICAIDEVDDRSYKLHTGPDDERVGHGSKLQIEGSETAPLTTNQQKLHRDDAGLTPKELEAARKEALSEVSGAGGGVTPTANTPNSTHASANGLRGEAATPIKAVKKMKRKRGKKKNERLIHLTNIIK